MSVDSLQDVFEVLPCVDLHFAAGGAEGHEDGGGPATGFAAEEQPVFAVMPSLA